MFAENSTKALEATEMHTKVSTVTGAFGFVDDLSNV